MASNNAEIKWTSDDAAVVRAFEKMERNMDTLARKMDNVERESKKASKAAESGFDKAAGAVMKVGAAIIGSGGIINALNTWSEANRRILEEANETGKAYDDMFRKFRVQSGLTQVETEKSRLRIMEVAERNATPVDVATAASTALIGADVSVEDATGGVLNDILRGIAAARVNGDPLDPAQVSTAITSYLKSQGTELTRENIANRVVGAQQIIGRSDFKMGDFQELTKVASGFKGYLSPEEQLAAFSTLITEGAKSAPESATNLRNVVARLTTAQQYPAQVAALERLGLKPSQVDLVGEDIGSVLSLFNERLQTVPEEDQAGILARMFEIAGVSGFKDLMNNRQKIQERIGQQTNVEEFNKLADIGLAGSAATSTRLEIQKQRRQVESNFGDDIIEQALREELVDRGYMPALTEQLVNRYRRNRSFNHDVEYSLGLAVGDGVTLGPWQFGNEDDVQAVLGRVDRASGGETGSKQLDALLNETRGMRQDMQQNNRAPRVRVPPAANLNGGGIR